MITSPARKATMRDVSRLAGVSQMTVSRVLADPDLVSEATRKRVMEAIEQLSYVPDRVAGSLFPAHQLHHGYSANPDELELRRYCTRTGRILTAERLSTADRLHDV